MDNVDLQALRQELSCSDRQEQQERRSLFSRRWFVRTLAGAAVGASAFARVNPASANQPGCDATHANNCLLNNTCENNDACGPNTCVLDNVCGKPGSVGGGNGNTCNISNTCNTDTCSGTTGGGNICAWFNACTAHGNLCTVNQCQSWNQCISNTCQVSNTCTLRNRCNGGTDFCQAYDNCTTNVPCSLFDFPCWFSNLPPGG